MKLKRVILSLAVLAFAIAISSAFSPRVAGDVNEPVYETVCDSAITLSTVVPPDLSVQDNSICGRSDKKTVFKSAISYFLEKHENSPPC